MRSHPRWQRRASRIRWLALIGRSQIQKSPPHNGSSSSARFFPCATEHKKLVLQIRPRKTTTAELTPELSSSHYQSSVRASGDADDGIHDHGRRHLPHRRREDAVPRPGPHRRQCRGTPRRRRRGRWPDHHGQRPVVRPGPRQVPGPVLGADAVVPEGRVPRRLRLGHGRPVRRPGGVRAEPGAGGDPRAVGDAGRAGVHHAGGAGEVGARGLQGARVVQGRRADLLRGRAGLPGQPQPGARAEHPRRARLPGRAHGPRRGVPHQRPRRRRRGEQPVPRRAVLRPARARRRPRHLRRAQGQGDQERTTRHVLHVRLLRAGHRHREGPAGEPARPPRRPCRQQRMGLRHQVRAGVLSHLEPAIVDLYHERMQII